jgi:hypothetical protein
MKYIKVTGDFLYGKDEITVKDLAEVKSGSLDTIINLENMTQFNADENKWVAIPHD